MELLRIVETDTIKAESQDIKLLDVSISNNLAAFGEIRLENYSGVFNGKFKVDDEIKISAGLRTDLDTAATLLFTGLIENVEEDSQLILKIIDFGKKLLDAKFKRTFNQVTPAQILGNILGGSGIEFELGILSTKKRHTYISPNGTLFEEINRANNSFGLNLIPFFDRTGKLLLKTETELIKATSIVYEDGEFKRFEENILETILDVEVDVFEEIEILGIKYLVNGHRFFINDRTTKSFITVAQN